MHVEIVDYPKELSKLYLLEALGGSGGPGGNPGRLAEEVGLRPRWNPLFRGRLG